MHVRLQILLQFSERTCAERAVYVAYEKGALVQLFYAWRVCECASVQRSSWKCHLETSVRDSTATGTDATDATDATPAVARNVVVGSAHQPVTTATAIASVRAGVMLLRMRWLVGVLVRIVVVELRLVRRLVVQRRGRMMMDQRLMVELMLLLVVVMLLMEDRAGGHRPTRQRRLGSAPRAEWTWMDVCNLCARVFTFTLLI